MGRPFFSIVIAAYNSERTIEYTLQSIRGQSIDQNELEILVVDGGSTDATKEIAVRYGAQIYDNPNRLPEHAKAIGTRHASGHYIVRMDSDEEFSYHTQLQDKMDFLKKNPELKVLISNRYISGRKDVCGICAEYMNTLGDPFSYFVYRTKIDKCETYRRNIIREEGKFILMKFEPCDIYPLVDSATSVISLDYMREKYSDIYDSVKFICRAYDQIISDTKLCGCIKGDDIKHNCSSTLKVYFSKLKFRVINNLFYKDESGFSAKEGMNNKLKYRKILFGLYVLIFPLPILDSVRLSIIYKDLTYLLHFIYLYYICAQIVVLSLGWLAGGKSKNSSYGK